MGFMLFILLNPKVTAATRLIHIPASGASQPDYYVFVFENNLAYSTLLISVANCLVRVDSCSRFICSKARQAALAVIKQAFRSLYLFIDKELQGEQSKAQRFSFFHFSYLISILFVIKLIV
jgi:hypothetical protein